MEDELEILQMENSRLAEMVKELERENNVLRQYIRDNGHKWAIAETLLKFMDCVVKCDQNKAAK